MAAETSQAPTDRASRTTSYVPATTRRGGAYYSGLQVARAVGAVVLLCGSAGLMIYGYYPFGFAALAVGILVCMIDARES